MLPDKRVTTHPGELLRGLFLAPAGISQRAFAEHLGITPARLSAIIRGKRSITAEIACLLSQALGTTPELWLNAPVRLRPHDHPQTVRKVKRLELGAP